MTASGGRGRRPRWTTWFVVVGVLLIVAAVITLAAVIGEAEQPTRPAWHRSAAAMEPPQRLQVVEPAPSVTG